jgi:hypothetical protein
MAIEKRMVQQQSGSLIQEGSRIGALIGKRIRRTHGLPHFHRGLPRRHGQVPKGGEEISKLVDQIVPQLTEFFRLHFQWSSALPQFINVWQVFHLLF